MAILVFRLARTQTSALRGDRADGPALVAALGKFLVVVISWLAFLTRSMNRGARWRHGSCFGLATNSGVAFNTASAALAREDRCRGHR